MKSIILIILLVIPIQSFAVTPIKKGQMSPIDGYIFSPKEEKKIREIREVKLKLEDLVIKKNEKINLQGKKIELLNDRIDNLKVNSWVKIGYFSVGVGVAALAVFLAGRLK